MLRIYMNPAHRPDWPPRPKNYAFLMLRIYMNLIPHTRACPELAEGHPVPECIAAEDVHLIADTRYSPHPLAPSPKGDGEL
jgi:hypothetical protein